MNVTIEIDEEDGDMYKKIGEKIGLSPSQILSHMYPSHLEDLSELYYWIETRGGEAAELGKEFVEGYGPGTITQDIKRVDPKHVTLREKLASQTQSPL